MRENGRPLVEVEKPKTEQPKKAVKKPVAEPKPVETAVKKNDKGTNRKSEIGDNSDR